jgi:hypothetical protein
MRITVGLAERHVVSREIDLSSHPQGGFALDEAEITRYITTTFAGVDVDVASSESGAPEIAWGDSFFIFDPDRNLDDTHRFPFAAMGRVERRKIRSDGRA